MVTLSGLFWPAHSPALRAPVEKPLLASYLVASGFPTGYGAMDSQNAGRRRWLAHYGRQSSNVRQS